MRYPDRPADVTACATEGYCSNPDICAGYQGGPSDATNDYYTSVVTLGLCYQIGLGIGDANTSAQQPQDADPRDLAVRQVHG